MEENSFDVEKELEILEYESLDNLIETATKTNFEKIIKLISELPSETEKDIYKNRLSKKLGVSPSSIKKDMKQQYENTDTETDDNKVLSANFSGLVELALDKKGNIAYIVTVQDKLCMGNRWNRLLSTRER
jgi:DNA primase